MNKIKTAFKRVKAEQSFKLFRARKYFVAAAFKFWPEFFTLFATLFLLITFHPSDAELLKSIKLFLVPALALMFCCIKTSHQRRRYIRKNEWHNMQREFRRLRQSREHELEAADRSLLN